MNKKPVHSLRYRIWNQTRLAMHVDGYFQIYDELTTVVPKRSWPFEPSGTIGSIKSSIYQSIIVHLDMIKSQKGVSLYKLVSEAQDTGTIESTTASIMRASIDEYADVLKNINRQRNNIVAHRSDSLTFREIKEKYPVSKEDLRNVIARYYFVASNLYEYAPFHNIWELQDTRTGTKVIMNAVMVNY